MKKQFLSRFWFRFKKADTSDPLNLGCGVTAYNYEDALSLLKANVFRDKGFPEILECLENVNLDTLDQKHVLPNIGIVTVRGIWFPQGY